MHVEVKELPSVLREALDAVNYGARDIRVVQQERVDLQVNPSDGQRGFGVLVDLEKHSWKRFVGSWGGANMFTKTEVDNSTGSAVLPPHGCIIKGTMGYPRTFATLYVSQEAIKLLPAAGVDEDLAEGEQKVINAYCGYTSAYRKELLMRGTIKQEDIDSLVEKGYIKRSKNGATQITTKGKNARSNLPGTRI